MTSKEKKRQEALDELARLDQELGLDMTVEDNPLIKDKDLEMERQTRLKRKHRSTDSL